MARVLTVLCRLLAANIRTFCRIGDAFRGPDVA